jgi:hypothetical protein
VNDVRTFPIEHWAFALGDEREAGRKAFDDSSWRAVTVPHDWSVELDFSPECSSGTGYLPGGIGWYRAHVPLHALDAPDDAQLRLVFQGAYKNADVWVNGYHLGGRPAGHLPFSFDVTEIVSYAPDDDLVVAVRVDRTEISDARWYNGSGLTRAVAIEVHGAVRLAENSTMFSTLSTDAGAAVIRVDQVFASTLPAPVTVQAHYELRALDSGTTERFTAEAEVSASGRVASSVTATVHAPELWSDTMPRLYRLTTTLSWDDRGARRRAEYSDVVGIRLTRFDADRGFFVNDEPRVLKGVCLHEDAGCFGTAVPAAVWLRRLLKLKEMGCNAIRMAHNPHAPELYALCDVLGFFVIDEAFDEWENPKNKWWQGHNVYPPRHEGAAWHFPMTHEQDLRDLVASHRNHPSIVAWSIGNEVDYPNDPYANPLFEEMTGNNDAHKPAQERAYDPSRPDTRRLTGIARRLAAIVREVDATRPVTLAAAFPELSSRTGLLDDLDLIGYNYKEHLYSDDHARFPRTPLMGSENGHGYEEWLAVTENEYISGQFLWTGIDYLGEARGWPVHGSGAGVLTLAGFEKPGWHLRRSWWAGTPEAHVVVRPRVADRPRGLRQNPASRFWAVDPDATLEVLCFVGAGRPRLSHAGAELPLEFNAHDGWWSAVTTARDAELVLEVHDESGVIARDAIRPERDAARLDVVVWCPPTEVARRCTAAGIEISGIVQLECVLRDADGGVAAADAVVSAEVDGGELLGLENGDLADSTPYRSPYRRTFDGRIAVFVGADATATVRLEVPGLPAVSLQT